MRCLARGEIPGCFLSTFNLPRLDSGDPVLGADIAYIGQRTDGQVPNITGSIVSVGGNLRSGSETVSGALYVSTENNAASGGANRGYKGIYFDASRSSSIYTNGQTRVKSAGVYMMYCVKY